MKKALTIVPVLLLLGFKLYAQDDYDNSEDNISTKDTLIMAVVGGGLYLVGKLISESKALSGYFAATSPNGDVAFRFAKIYIRNGRQGLRRC